MHPKKRAILEYLAAKPDEWVPRGAIATSVGPLLHHAGQLISGGLLAQNFRVDTGPLYRITGVGQRALSAEDEAA